MTEIVPRAGVAVGRFERLRAADAEIRRDQALLEVLRRAKSDLRRQVEVLAAVVGHAYEAVGLVDEMRETGELVEASGGKPSDGRTVSLERVGLDRRRLAEWRELLRLEALPFLEQALADEREETFERVSLEWLLKRLQRIAREDEAEARREAGTEAVSVHDDIEIRHGDLRDALADLSDVDAIITDPPYPAEFLDEFDALGELAARVLKANGVLVAMVGQTHLPTYLERLGAHLPYRWCGAYLTDGPATRIHGRKVGTKWKPLLIFGGSRFLTQDVFSSAAAEKDVIGQVDGWGQSETGMADIVARFTEPGETIVDPFLGAGTTAVICRELGRRFIGCDIDADAVVAARERLA